MTSQTESHTRVRAGWLPIARLAWAAGLLTLTAMYALGFLAVREALSTVCEDEQCSLARQIRHTETGEQVVGWPGPPIGYADRLRPNQVEALKRLGLTLDQYGWLGALQLGIPTLVYLLIAAWLFWRKSDNWMVLFASIMVATFLPTDMPLPYTLTVRQPAWEWVLIPAESAALVCFLIFPLIFPTGRFVPRWTRWMVLFDIAGVMVVTLFQNTLLETPSAVGLVPGFIVIAFGTGVYAQLYRYFRVASPVERQQLKWVIVGLAGYITGGLALLPLNALLASQAASMDPARALVLSAVPDTLFRATSLFLPVSIAISVLRYRLWDIDFILSRALVYGALTAGIVGLYILVVGALSALSQSTGNLLISLVATGLIALLFQPLRERLQRVVNRLLYGERDEPYAVLTRLGQRLESVIEPAAALSLTVETVAQALKLPYVAIALKSNSKSQLPNSQVEPERSGFIVVAAYGASPNSLTRLPLMVAGETIGELVAAARAPNETLSPADQRLLSALARQISLTAHAKLLADDLELARLRIVSAREEARRRLGSDLHDGVGHQLAGLARQAELANQLLAHDPTAARAMLGEVTEQLNATILQVRGLAHQLHPPELELLGLMGALRERAQTHTGLAIRIDAPETLPPLPTAVETAAYYIALEALTNVEKHAGAKSCRVRLALANDALEMDITDDGRGLPPEKAHGLGLLSMQARAAEVGGTCRFESPHPAGTRVSVRLPCRAQLE